MIAQLAGARRHRISIEVLPRLLGYHIKLDFYDRLVFLEDGEVVEVEPQAFEWERINIDDTYIVAGYCPALNVMAAHVVVGEDQHQQLRANARLYGYIVLFDERIGRLG